MAAGTPLSGRYIACIASGVRTNRRSLSAALERRGGLQRTDLQQQVNRHICGPNPGQGATIDLRGDHVVDGRGHPLASRGGRPRRLLVGENHDVGLRNPELGQQTADLGEWVCSGGVDQPTLAGETSAIDPQFGMTDQAQAVPHHCFGFDARQPRADGHIGQPFLHERSHLRRGRHPHADLDPTGAGGERLQQRRDDRLRQGAGRHHTQQLGSAVRLPHRSLGIDSEVDHLRGDRHDAATGRRQLHACPTTGDQRVVEMLTQRRERLRDRRFADPQRGRRGANGPQSRDQHEHLQLGERHCRGTVGRTRRPDRVEITLRLGAD